MKKKSVIILALLLFSVTGVAGFAQGQDTVNIYDINKSVQDSEKKEIQEMVKTIEDSDSGTQKSIKMEDGDSIEKTPTQGKQETEAEKKLGETKKDIFDKVPNADKVVRLSIQSKEELQSLYNRGFRVFEICVSLTLDSQLVLADNFGQYFQKYYGAEIPTPTIDQYFQKKMLNGNTQMSMGDINVFLNQHPDARFFVKSVENNNRVFEALNQKSFKNKDKLIIEINDVVANYRTLDNIAMVDLKGEMNIYSYSVNHKDKNIIFLYEKTTPNEKEKQMIQEQKERIYQNNASNIFAQNDTPSTYQGMIYAIEDALNLNVVAPKENIMAQNKYSRPQIKNDRFIAHAGGKVSGIVGTNALQAMNNSYTRGNRLIELDYDWTTDGKLVQLHDWGTFSKLLGGYDPSSQLYLKYDEYKRRKMIYGLKQMSLEDTVGWLKEHLGAYIVTDVKSDNRVDSNIHALSLFAKEGKEIQERIIPQIYDTSEYDKIKKLGFNHIIYTLYRTQETPYNILEFAKCNDLYAITMDNLYRIHTGLPELLINNGVRVYIHTENDKNTAKQFIYSGKAYGIYSDDILTEEELFNS